MSAIDFKAVAASSPFFQSASSEVLGRLAAGVHRTRVPRGKVLFIEGEAPDAAYLVESGVVRLYTSELDGTETTVRAARDGELFGELAIIDAGERAASAIALRDTTLFVLPGSLISASLPALGTLERSLLRGLVSVVRSNTRRLVIERSQRLESAIAHAISEDPDVLRRISQGELASLLGVSRQSVNQTLRAWERDGLIRRTDGRTPLIDIESVRQRYLV